MFTKASHEISNSKSNSYQTCVKQASKHGELRWMYCETQKRYIDKYRRESNPTSLQKDYLAKLNR